MMRLVEGRPGAGKTLYVVARLLRLRRRFPNLDIYTNFHFGEFDSTGHLVKPYSTIIRSWDEFAHIHNGVVAIDESSAWCPAENNKTLPRGQRMMLKQHRKNGVDVWLTDQNIDHTSKVVRDLVAMSIRLKRYGPLCIGECRDPENGEDMGKEWLFVSPKVFDYYRTDEIIGDGVTGEGYGFGGAEKYKRVKPAAPAGPVLGGRQLVRLYKPDPVPPVRWEFEDAPDFPALRRSGWVACDA